ncbi:MAG: hypothetical protein IT229_04725 [Flavobacteriales bacterium]|nr:hypothetical protein [Flavobacteriales bacterium]
MNRYTCSFHPLKVPAVWLWRCCLSALAICFALGATAQRSRELSYKVTFSGTIGTVQEKFILDAFYAQDPAMILSLDLAQMQGKVRTTVMLDADAIRNVLEPLGVGVSLATTNAPEGNDLRSALGLDFPTYIDSGSPLADQADYEARKQAWISANPQAYQELLQQQREP